MITLIDHHWPWIIWTTVTVSTVFNRCQLFGCCDFTQLLLKGGLTTIHYEMLGDPHGVQGATYHLQPCLSKVWTGLYIYIYLYICRHIREIYRYITYGTKEKWAKPTNMGPYRCLEPNIDGKTKLDGKTKTYSGKRLRPRKSNSDSTAIVRIVPPSTVVPLLRHVDLCRLEMTRALFRWRSARNLSYNPIKQAALIRNTNRTHRPLDRLMKTLKEKSQGVLCVFGMPEDQVLSIGDLEQIKAWMM